MSLDELSRRNPWSRTPLAPPYVLGEDQAGASRYRLEKIPSPWSGPAFSASVVMLLLNPGYSEEVDRADLLDGEFVAMSRAQLSGTELFPWLLPRWSDAGGATYWRPRLRELRADVGDAAIARGFATVQWLAYASKTWEPPVGRIPSQGFTADVVRSAVARGAVIVVARSWTPWLALVPELETASVVRLRQPRSPYVTLANAGESGYQRIVDGLRHDAPHPRGRE